MLLLLAAAQAVATVPAKPKLVFVEPPKVEQVAGPIEAVLLSPLFAKPFACVEHWDGQMDYAGDALGTDCQIVGGIGDDDVGFARYYRTDGKTNADWYGWHAEVLSPVDGVVAGLFPKAQVNEPGTLGRPPAGMLQIRREDGLMVTLGHVTDMTVKAGERVTTGQVIARVGNNGMSRAPHIHIGASRGRIPLQIRWDQRAMARLIKRKS